MRLRAMQRSEAPRVGALTLAAYDAHGLMRGGYRSYLGDPLQRIDGCTALLVADIAGDVVGTVTLVRPGDEQWEGRAHGLYRRLGFVRRPDLDVRFPSGHGVAFTCDLTPDAAEHFAPPGPPPTRPPWYEDVRQL